MNWIFLSILVASAIIAYWWVQQPGKITSVVQYDQNKHRYY